MWARSSVCVNLGGIRFFLCPRFCRKLDLLRVLCDRGHVVLGRSSCYAVIKFWVICLFCDLGWLVILLKLGFCLIGNSFRNWVFMFLWACLFVWA